MGFFGNLIGQGLGYGAAKLYGTSDDTAKTVSGITGQIGSYLPFQKGGYMLMRKGGLADANEMAMGGYVPPGLRQISTGNKQFHIMPYPVLGEKRLI